MIESLLNFIEGYWLIITAIAGFIFYYYRKEMDKYEFWQNEYLNTFLVQFHLQYLVNTELLI